MRKSALEEKYSRENHISKKKDSKTSSLGKRIGKRTEEKTTSRVKTIREKTTSGAKRLERQPPLEQINLRKNHLF